MVEFQKNSLLIKQKMIGDTIVIESVREWSMMSEVWYEVKIFFENALLSVWAGKEFKPPTLLVDELVIDPAKTKFAQVGVFTRGCTAGFDRFIIYPPPPPPEESLMGEAPEEEKPKPKDPA